MIPRFAAARRMVFAVLQSTLEDSHSERSYGRMSSAFSAKGFPKRYFSRQTEFERLEMDFEVRDTPRNSINMFPDLGNLAVAGSQARP